MAYQPTLQVQNQGASLTVLYVDNTELTRNKTYTFLTEDITAAGTTFRVQSITGFESLSTSSGQIVCIGKIGEERTELRRTTNSSADGYPSESYKEIALRDALRFDHPQDTPVTIVDWNRAEFVYAASASGTKTSLSAYPAYIQADAKYTLFRDVTESADRLTGSPSTAFYFVRFNETIGTRNSSWSDSLYGTGYDDNSVYNIKKRALDELGEEIDGKVITHEFLNQALWQARREYHQAPGKRPFRRKFNTVIGSALTGSYRIELPTDVERPATAENIYGVRIGTEANMDYYDKKEFDFDYRNKPHSTLDVPYTRDTSTSLWIANGRDFSDSATVQVENTSISLSRITGETSSFTIITHGSYSASGGSDVWENTSFGLPSKFTVWADVGGSAYIYFNRPLETAYINQNIYADYYRTLVGYNSDGDVLDEPKYDMYVDYLKARIRQRRAKGNFDITNDSDYKLWEFKKQTNLQSEYLATNIRIEPEISHLQMPD